MFYEACNKANLNIHNLNKTYIYSFVLQHPDNRIVVQIDEPKLYLVDIFQLIDNNNIVNVNYVVIDKDIYKATLDTTKPINIHYPEIYHNNSKQKEIDTYKNKYSNHEDYNILGMVIKNIKTGNRCKVRNSKYNYVKTIRGNQPNIIYRFIDCLKKNNINEYLSYFSEDKQFFVTYETRLKQYIKHLHSNYVNCFIRKNNVCKDYPLLFRYHMNELHKVYKTTKKKIYIDTIKQYINSLEQMEIFNILNVYSDN
jgi:hypothetical protein